jgi:phosphohistidine phosphatase
MDLLVIRHGVAIDREDWSGNDDLRPLTDDGITKMRKGAQGLRTIVESVDVLASSALVRARQTAEIVAKVVEHPRDVETVDALRPDQPPDALLPWAERYADQDTVAIVGHEPHLSALVTWLLTGKRGSSLDLKKGGACLLRFNDELKAGHAQLVWLLTPAQLRALAR